MAAKSSTTRCEHNHYDISYYRRAARINFQTEIVNGPALRCEMVSCDAMTSGFVSDLFTSSRSSGHREGGEGGWGERDGGEGWEGGREGEGRGG